MNTIYCPNTKITAEHYPKDSNITLILLHGFGLGRAIFQDIIPSLNAEVWNVSLPGFDSTPAPEQVNLEQLATSLNEFVTQHIHGTKLLLGHSLGGYLALEMAALLPTKYQSIGLLHSHPFGDSKEKQKERKQVSNFVLKYGTLIYAKEAFKKLCRDYPNNHYQKLVDTYSTIEPAVIAQYSLAMAERSPRKEVLSKHNCILISGEHDHIIPKERYSEMAETITRGVWFNLKKTGHMGMIEESEELVKMLNSYLLSLTA